MTFYSSSKSLYIYLVPSLQPWIQEIQTMSVQMIFWHTLTLALHRHPSAQYTDRQQLARATCTLNLVSDIYLCETGLQKQATFPHQNIVCNGSRPMRSLTSKEVYKYLVGIWGARHQENYAQWTCSSDILTRPRPSSKSRLSPYTHPSKNTAQIYIDTQSILYRGKSVYHQLLCCI